MGSLIFIGFLLFSLFGGYHLSYFSFRPLVISKFQFLFLFLRSLPGDLSFGNLFIWKLHQVHFVFLLIVLGLVFVLYVFSLFFSGFNLYCWRGIHFSWSNSLIFLVVFSNLLFSFHFWFRDLLRELAKKYEILLMILFLLFFLFLAS